MAHVPHLYLPAPWDGAVVALTPDARHHLGRVLRRGEGAPVTYTDGAGVVGEGTLSGVGVVRGDERTVPAPPPLVMAVAPPHSTDRARFVVEKLAELGVSRLVWLTTEHTQGRAPAKALAWAVGALEQSRGAHLLGITGPVGWDGLGGDVVVADPAGAPTPPPAGAPLTVVIGPEGGFAPGEIPAGARNWSLGDRILRTDTAAIVAAARILDAS